MRAGIPLILLLTLSACSADRTEDLQQWMKESSEGLRGKVDPVPEVKAYEPFTYDAFDIPDPFKPRKLSSKGGGGIQPDLNRPKEALEVYPLENLKMVGTLRNNRATYAVIKTPDNSLYRVRAGNYMGLNFGVVTKITETEVHIKEIVQDSAGDWTERENTIQLQEEEQKK